MKTAIVGLTAGDEGKGRCCAYFAKDTDWTIKFNGGPNSGHTVIDNDGRAYKFHHLTAGAAFQKKVAIDTGSVLDLNILRKELKETKQHVDLYISENVHLIQSRHIEKDSSGSGVGSTKKGIAYVYADRALRKGKRVTQSDLDKHGIKATIYRGLPPVKIHENALFEGAQGLMIDIDYGEYNRVTSSSIMPSSVHRIDKFIGVMKAYLTRVGDTFIEHPDIPLLRKLGNEFGTTTGRPRKCTWNDIDQLKYAISIVQPDEIVVTKLDILNGMNDITVYKNGEPYVIGNLDSYKDFLISTFKQIKWFSEAPDGDLIKAQ